MGVVGVVSREDIAGGGGGVGGEIKLGICLIICELWDVCGRVTRWRML